VKKKSELCDKKSQLSFFIFHSVAETRFHTKGHSGGGKKNMR